MAKLSTGVAGRSFRGRLFLSGVPEGSFDGNLLGGSAPADMRNGLFALKANIVAAGGTWVVVSRYSGYTQSPPKYKKVPTPRTAGIATPVDNISVDVRLASQRRRLAGRGA